MAEAIGEGFAFSCWVRRSLYIERDSDPAYRIVITPLLNRIALRQWRLAGQIKRAIASGEIP